MPRHVPLEDQIAELEREIKVREHVYARWVQTGKMKEETARRQRERLEAARDTLVGVQAERLAQLAREPLKLA